MDESKNNRMDDILQDNQVQASSRGKKVFKLAMITTGVLVGIVIVSLVLSLNYTSVETIDTFLQAARPWLKGWRLLVFLLVFGFWRPLSIVFSSWSSMSSEQLERMLSYRWRMAAWVLIMEAIFSQKILNQFVNQLLNSGGIL